MTLAEPMTIGAGESAPTGVLGGFFDGEIDELSEYNRALSADEIRAIYQAGIAGKCQH